MQINYIVYYANYFSPFSASCTVPLAKFEDVKVSNDKSQNKVCVFIIHIQTLF